MVMHVDWDDAGQTIILCESEGKWTWEEYHQALDKMVQMIKSVPHRVDIVTDKRANSIRPSGSGTPHYQRAMRMMPDNAGMNIVVNTNTLARMVVSMFLRLYGSKARGQVTLAASAQDAREMIAKDRAKNAAR